MTTKPIDHAARTAAEAFARMIYTAEQRISLWILELEPERQALDNAATPEEVAMTVKSLRRRAEEARTAARAILGDDADDELGHALRALRAQNMRGWIDETGWEFPESRAY